MAKTRFFRTAVEGATATDGRTITREMIDQSAEAYNTVTYTARINCEHLRGFSPQPPFNSYGSVIALKAEDFEITIDGQKQTKRALYAQFDANDQMVATIKADQKIFTSCEFQPNFAKTGKFGLVGLAITDNPASLGTEALKFSAFKPMWDARKSDPTNFFTAAEENVFALETPVAQPDASAGALGAMKAFFEKFTASPSPTPPLITERDENGKPYVPAYYHSKQYIDFTDAVKHEERYQELLRWLYDKPQHKKPKLGTAPSFIIAPDAVVTATTSKMKQAEQFIKTNNAAAGGAITDFGEAVFAEYTALRPSKDGDGPWDDVVIKTAESLRPAIRNLSELVLAEARYGGTNFNRFLRIFERLGSLMYRQSGVATWNEDDFDPYRMMCYEGFLATASILIMESRFDLLQAALNHPYLIEGRERGGSSATTTFRVFCQDVASFRHRNDRMQANRIDMYADEIAEIYKSSFPSFQQMLQADLVLFLRGQIVQDNFGYENWFGRTIIYAGRSGLPELFARSESRQFFDSWAPLIFGAIDIDDFKSKVAELNKGTRRMWSSGFMGPSLVNLTNYENLGQRA